MTSTLYWQQLCRECTDWTQSSQPSSQSHASFAFSTGSLYLKLDLPPGTDIGAIRRFRKSFCLNSQCKQEQHIPLPRDIYPHLFSAFQPPSTEEEDDINRSRETVQQDLSIVDALISATETYLEELKQRRGALTGRISQYNHLLSAMRRLPSGVFADIIALAIPKGTDGFFSYRDHLPAHLSGAWLFSRVCASWRSVILNTPLLWSYISVGNNYSPPLLSEHIKRSQNVPLEIEFRSFNTKNSKLLLQLICPHSRRWRSVELYIFPSHWSRLSRVRNTLDQLQYLGINIIRANGRRQEPQDTIENDELDFFAFAPQLRTVRLGLGVSDSWDAPGSPQFPLQFPCGPVVNFAFRLEDGGSYPCICQMIPRSVIELSAYVPADYPLSTSPVVSSEYPFVRSLEVTGENWILDAFTCPQLEMFIIRDSILKEGIQNRLGSFVDRSSLDHTFSTLVLKNVRLPFQFSASAMFERISFITELDMNIVPAWDHREDGWSSDDDIVTSDRMILFLQSLQIVANRSSVLPSLSTLKLECSIVSPTPRLYRVIHQVVNSRVDPPDTYSGKKLLEFRFRIDYSETGEITLDTYDELLQRAQTAAAERQALETRDTQLGDDEQFIGDNIA